MNEQPDISEIEYLKECVNDLIDLIDRANMAIAFHRGYETPDQLAIQQYNDLKRDYTRQLVELFRQLDITVQLPTDKAA